MSTRSHWLAGIAALLLGCARPSPAASPATAPSSQHTTAAGLAALPPTEPANEVEEAPPPPFLLQPALDAAGQGKPLVVLFHATWCPGCDELDATVLTVPRVQAALAEVVFVRLDIDTQAGTVASFESGCESIPLLVSIGRDGRVARRKVDPSADEVVELVSQAKSAFAGGR